MKQLHPIVSASYYLGIIILTMVLDNPVCILISICGGVISIAVNKGWRGTWKGILWFLPVILITAVINPLFSHEGMTILGHFSNGNPITAESIWYGAGMAGALAAVILWFVSVNEVITSEKIMYLLGRMVPSFALILALTLRIVPRFTGHVKQVYALRKSATAALSASVTWILDDSIHTAESMRCRGYGLPGRTTYSRYVFRRYDGLWLSAIILLSAYALYGELGNSVYWQYYPYITGHVYSIPAISTFAVYTVLCIAPSCLMKRGK